ncbi:MAG: TetR/AcrR family transcriptional regulator [Flavobacteriales bacterium]|nr:TetR/AcrR family transcriptional regulator [Flavobacteriales bacterium]
MAHYQLIPDPTLHLRDPGTSVVGERILSEGLALMNELGLEVFTFKKLAERAECTEATIYKYFPNKQRLLQYYFQLYWMWLDTHCQQEGRLLPDAWERLQGTFVYCAGSGPRMPWRPNWTRWTCVRW